MSHRSLKDSFAFAGDPDENSALFSANRRADDSSEVKVKAARHFLQHAHHSSVVPPDGPTGTQPRSVLAARKTTALKVRSVSAGRAASKRESSPSSRPTRSSSATRPTISASQTTAFPTVRSSSAPKKTTSASASVSSHSSPPPLKLNSTLSGIQSSTRSTVQTPSRFSTRSTVQTTSRSSTPSSRVSSKSTIPSVGKPRSAPNSRSSTPISRPQSTANAAAESVMPGSSGRHLLSSERRSVSGSRSSSAGRSISSRDSPPQTTARLKATETALAPRHSATITKKGTTATSSVTRGRSNGHATDTKDPPKASSGVSGRARGKSSSAEPGRAMSKTSLEMAIKHMDIGKVGRRPFSSPTLYPQSKRSSSASKAESGSKGLAEQREKCSGEGGDDGRSLTEVGEAERHESARYDALFFVKDVKDTNWLLSMDEPSSDSDQSLLFDDGFEPPPEPFPPL